MAKTVRFTISGIAIGADVEQKCLVTVRPFIDDRDKPAFEFVAAQSENGDIFVKIDCIGLTLLRHPRMLEPDLVDELIRVEACRSLRASGSTQFQYVPGTSEKAAAVVGK